jgi:exonuclease III
VGNIGFKLWYKGKERNRNGVDILIVKNFKNEVIAVRKQDDMIIMIKLVIRDLIVNVINVYTP